MSATTYCDFCFEIYGTLEQREWLARAIGYVDGVSCDNDGLCLAIESDENGDPDKLARVLKAYQRKFGTGPIAFEVSYWSDRHINNGFGGAVYAIADGEILVVGTDKLLELALDRPHALKELMQNL